MVPAEYLKSPGDLSFGVFGTTGDESIVRYVGEYVNIRISDGAVEDVTATGVTAYDQLLWEMASKLDRRQGTEHVGKVLTVGDDGIASPQYPAMKEWTKLPTFYKEVMTSGDFFVDVVKLDISKDLSDIPLGLYYDSGVNDSRGEKPYYYGTGVRIVDGEARLHQLAGTGPVVNINMITDEKIKITFFGADLNPQVVYTFDRTSRTLDASWIDSLSRMKTVELLKEKVDIAQGAENAGRILQMDKDGNVVPSDVLAEKIATEDYVGEAIIDSVPDWDQYDSTAKDFVKNRTHRREWLYYYPCGKVERLTEQIQKIARLPRDTDYYLTRFRTYFDFDAFQSQTDFSTSVFYMKWPVYSTSVKKFLPASLEQPDFIRLAGYQFEKIDSINWRMSAGSAGSMSSKAYLIVVLDTSTLSAEYIDVCSSVGLYLDVREYDGDALFTDVYTDIELGVRQYVALDERYIPSSIARTADIENLPKTNEEEIAMLIETDTLPAVQNADGKLLSTGSKIIMRH